MSRVRLVSCASLVRAIRVATRVGRLYIVGTHLHSTFLTF